MTFDIEFHDWWMKNCPIWAVGSEPIKVLCVSAFFAGAAVGVDALADGLKKSDHAAGNKGDENE